MALSFGTHLSNYVHHFVAIYITLLISKIYSDTAVLHITFVVQRIFFDQAEV